VFGIISSYIILLLFIALSAAPVGDEDCLYLDITVPMTVQKGRPFQHKKKPVIVYIHGGAYRFGAKTWFLGAPLAVAGDVVMVTFNYRVGPFGFLSEGPGKFSEPRLSCMR